MALALENNFLSYEPTDVPRSPIDVLTQVIREFPFLFEEDVGDILKLVAVIFLTSSEAKQSEIIDLICLIGEKLTEQVPMSLFGDKILGSLLTLLSHVEQIEESKWA